MSRKKKRSRLIARFTSSEDMNYHLVKLAKAVGADDVLEIPFMLRMYYYKSYRGVHKDHRPPPLEHSLERLYCD